MFNGVEYVRQVCKDRNIPISTLEKECCFANGYLNPKKLKKIPYDRAVLIADYLQLDVNYLLTGDKKPQQEHGSCEYYGRCHDRDAAEMTSKYLELDDIDRAKVAERIDTLLESEKYSSKEGLGSA